MFIYICFQILVHLGFSVFISRFVCAIIVLSIQTVPTQAEYESPILSQIGKCHQRPSEQHFIKFLKKHLWENNGDYLRVH